MTTFSKNVKKSFSLKHKWIELILCIYLYAVSLYLKCVFFCSSWIGTLVAMAIIFFHGLMIDKMENDNSFLSQ